MSKMNNCIDYIEFPAKDSRDLHKMRDFFTRVFGWNYTMYGNDYADTADSGVSSGVNAENPSLAPLTVVYVTDLRQTYEKVKAIGAVITREIFEFPGGKRFHFQDPTGNELAVWSDKQ